MADWYIRLLISDWEMEFYEVCLPEIDFSFFLWTTWDIWHIQGMLCKIYCLISSSL